MCKGWTAVPAGKLAFIFFYFLHAQQHLEGTQLTTLCRLVLCSGATALAAIKDLLYEITPGLPSFKGRSSPHTTYSPLAGWLGIETSAMKREGL